MIHSLWNLRTVISDALHRPHNRPLCSSFSPASPSPPLSPPPLFFLCNPRVKHDFQECRGTIIAQHVEIIQLQVSENFPSAREKKERTWSLLFTLISQPCTVRSPAKFHVSRRILLSEGSNVLGEMVGFRIGGARPRCARDTPGRCALIANPIRAVWTETRWQIDSSSVERLAEMQLKGYRLVGISRIPSGPGSFRWSIVEFTRHANSLLRRDFS